ncbi:PREDICTED: uncharacterized protein LOC104755436 [Camelina sativa]|uniref:Uncharacterized protein LOC104755436 n=1 Tax=Camelina sativa TaxID=90675 RepID=A0ABM1QIY5_CAMSA|nr:PREDICTED: uncharacterized protein LOC104755436 [Camelina sativa]
MKEVMMRKSNLFDLHLYDASPHFPNTRSGGQQGESLLDSNRIHKNCIGFPHVIRISRHPHRISFTSSLPSSRNLSCGVCRKQVDNNYGAYSCKTCESYFVHSKCALNPNVWDGKELEGVPEKDDEIDDGEPFKRIADGIILHPFHSHHLRFEISKEAYDANKYCRGCALPVYEGGFYSCVECNFILHENCANASRMKRYPLYPHPLTLKVATKGIGTDEGIFQCNQCAREGTGYFYEHHIDGRNFKLDLRCALITEPFDFQGHKHPLFLASEPYELTLCHMCKEESDDSKLICIECDYILCYRCATFPYKARYKHDNHILIICDREKGSGQQDWCEICEGKIEEGGMLFFYKCHDCCIALHVECLLGRDIYMKPGDTIKDSVSVVVKTSKLTRPKWIEFWILLNSSLSRPICIGCRDRCPFPIFFKGYNDKIFCSQRCIRTRLRNNSIRHVT